MQLTELSLSNYRNYDQATVSFTAGINVLIGENAQGKTNLMEAIHVLALSKSHRTSNDRELIQFDKDSATIRGSVQKKNTVVPLSLSITKKGKQAKVNHLEQKKLSQYIGQLNVVLFAPEDLTIVKGAPTFRRKFIDMELGQMNPVYLHELVHYQRVLKQRNHYLRQLMMKKQKDLVYLEVLTQQLAILGAKLMVHRYAFVAELQHWAQQTHQYITTKSEQLRLQYVSSIASEVSDNEDVLFEQLMSQYLLSQRKELDQGTTLYGPHRDDVALFINDQNVQFFGSQGQQRTVALSLKLAEIDLMLQKTGEYPVLLLDDVLSELDDYRQTSLLQAINPQVQTFITTTSLDGINKNSHIKPTVFTVTAGRINRTSEGERDNKDER